MVSVQNIQAAHLLPHLHATSAPLDVSGCGSFLCDVRGVALVHQVLIAVLRLIIDILLIVNLYRGSEQAGDMSECKTDEL